MYIMRVNEVLFCSFGDLTRQDTNRHVPCLSLKTPRKQTTKLHLQNFDNLLIETALRVKILDFR